MSGMRKAVKYPLLLPSALMLGAQLALFLLDLKLKQMRAAGNFKKGLLSAGVSRAEAERITRVCFNGDS